MARAEANHASLRLISITAGVILLFALRELEEVLAPLAVAILLTFLLSPLVRLVERRRVKRTAAVVLVVLLSMGVLTSLGWLITSQLQSFVTQLPRYAGNIENKLSAVRSTGLQAWDNVMRLASRLRGDGTTQPAASQPAAAQPAATSAPSAATTPATGASHAVNNAIQQVEVVSSGASPMVDVVKNVFGSALTVVATIFIITILVIFMLMNQEDLRDRIIRLVSRRRLDLTTQAMDEAAERVSRYLLLVALVNGTYAALIALGLYLIGIPNALLWGLLAGLLRFIPYLGPWMGAFMPLLLSITIFPGIKQPLLTGGLFLTIEIIVSSFVEPWLYGSRTGVSPIAILLSAIFWAWAWGPVGLMLSPPITVLLAVLGKYVPQMEFFSILLGDEPVFDAKTRFFQRLLAEDPEEAAEVVDEQLQNDPSLLHLYDSIVIPALTMAQLDYRRDTLDESKFTFICQAIRDLVEDLGERQRTGKVSQPASALPGGKWVDKPLASPAPVPGADRIRVLCLPASAEADELTALMVAQVLQGAGYVADAVASTKLASEMVEMAGRRQAELAVIAALPPAAVTHTRYLCKRLHARFGELKLIALLYQSKGDPHRTAQRAGCGADDRVSTTLAQALEEITQMTPAMVLQASKREPPQIQKTE